MSIDETQWLELEPGIEHFAVQIRFPLVTPFLMTVLVAFSSTFRVSSNG